MYQLALPVLSYISVHYGYLCRQTFPVSLETHRRKSLNNANLRFSQPGPHIHHLEHVRIGLTPTCSMSTVSSKIDTEWFPNPHIHHLEHVRTGLCQTCSMSTIFSKSDTEWFLIPISTTWSMSGSGLCQTCSMSIIFPFEISPARLVDPIYVPHHELSSTELIPGSSHVNPNKSRI